MPEISRFFGIVIRMYFDDHSPAHIHAEHQGHRAVFDLKGNLTLGSLDSRTATRLVREWIDIHMDELHTDWELAQNGQSLNWIPPLE